MSAGRALPAALLGATLAGAAAPDPLAGRVAGPPSRCVEPARLQAPEIQADGFILYRQDRGRVWRVLAQGSCPALNPRQVVEPRNGPGFLLCRGDYFRVVDRTSATPRSLCRFGAFVPFDLAAR